MYKYLYIIIKHLVQVQIIFTDRFTEAQSKKSQIIICGDGNPCYTIKSFHNIEIQNNKCPCQTIKMIFLIIKHFQNIIPYSLVT